MLHYLIDQEEGITLIQPTIFFYDLLYQRQGYVLIIIFRKNLKRSFNIMRRKVILLQAE